MEKLMDFLGTACLVVVAPIIFLVVLVYLGKIWGIVLSLNAQRRCIAIPFLANACALLGNCSEEWTALLGIVGIGIASYCIGYAGKPALTAAGVAAHVALFIWIVSL